MDPRPGDDQASLLPLEASRSSGETLPDVPGLSATQMLDLAAELEDAGRLPEAAEVYRAYLMRTGPDAAICFSLAELLYRSGDAAGARERYYMAIELDDEYVEARANLGCVLAELGEGELALAAFQGTLERYPDYPDVHYHMAQLLEDLGRAREAVSHWRQFAQLAPDSPWADEARQRLDQEQ
jgi:tetratricopeptide (TPR) repeat protein